MPPIIGMIFTKVLLVLLLEAFFPHDVTSQISLLKPGNYRIIGQIKPSTNGSLEIQLNAKKQAGPSSQPTGPKATTTTTATIAPTTNPTTVGGKVFSSTPAGGASTTPSPSTGAGATTSSSPSPGPQSKATTTVSPGGSAVPTTKPVTTPKIAGGASTTPAPSLGPQSKATTTVSPGGSAIPTTKPITTPKKAGAASTTPAPSPGAGAITSSSPSPGPQSKPTTSASPGGSAVPTTKPIASPKNAGGASTTPAQSPRAGTSTSSSPSPGLQWNATTTARPGGSSVPTEKPITTPKNAGGASTTPAPSPGPGATASSSPSPGPQSNATTTASPGLSAVPTTKPITTPKNAGLKAGRQVALHLHNKYRKIHNSPMMQLSPQLNEDAQLFAETLAGLNMLVHDKGALKSKSEGENIGVHCSRRSDVKSMKKVVDAWYEEVCDYNFDDQKFAGATAHFTQLVWKKSTQLGIGYSKGSFSYKGGRLDDCLFVVARYKEVGNKKGEFEQNVMKGSFNRKDTCPGEEKRNSVSAKLKFNKNAKKRNFLLIH